MKVLVAEDDPDIQAILKMVLTKLGKSDVAVAFQGNEVLPLAKQCNPDLILLDVMLPDLNGFEICALLKKTEETKKIPIIFLSAYSMASEMKKGIDLGALGYLTKPFDPMSLIQQINQALLPTGKKLG